MAIKKAPSMYFLNVVDEFKVFLKIELPIDLFDKQLKLIHQINEFNSEVCDNAEILKEYHIHRCGKCKRHFKSHKGLQLHRNSCKYIKG